ncbi:MAG: hypothetical protein NC191_10080, partial [Muribaculaceae bacterium]|nr:hypothetical protein [Muribaculaceae bacterium]
MPEEELEENLSEETQGGETTPELPVITVNTPIGLSLSGTINPSNKTIDSAASLTTGSTAISLKTTTSFADNQLSLDAIGVNASQGIDFQGSGHLDLSANMMHNGDSNTAGLTSAYSGTVGSVSIEGNGSVTVGGENGTEHNVDVTLSDTILGIDSSVVLHSDSQDSSITITGKKALLNPDNLDGHDDYQDRKEELQESGDHFSFSSKVGYSNEQESFYTNNSLMYRV